MADERFYAALSLFMGVFAFYAAKYADRVMARRRSKETQPFEEWYLELERHAFELCRAHLDVAVIQAGLAALLAKVPPDFTPATFKALGLGEALERAVIDEAVRRGLPLPEGLAQPQPAASAPGGAVLPFPSQEPPGPALVWRDGTLRPRRS